MAIINEPELNLTSPTSLPRGPQAGDIPVTAPAPVLERLRQAMSTGPEFPVFAQNVQTLVELPAESNFPVQEAAGVILRDISLTTHILKVVNTIYYRSYARQIHTVTTAVMVLGMERIRELAISLKIIERLQESQSLASFKRLALLSLLTAVYSQELARHQRQFKSEEIFINSLLYNIGELITAFYLPQDYQQVVALAEAEHIPLSRAAHQVLKLAYPDLGLATLRFWGLPDHLCESLADLYDPQGPSHAGGMREFIQAAQEMAGCLLDPELSQDDWLRKGQRLGRRLGIDAERLAGSLESGLERFRGMIQATRIDLPAVGLFLPPNSKAPDASGQPEADSPCRKPQGDEPGRSDPLRGENRCLQDELQRLRMCSQILGDVNQALVTRLPINEVMAMIMEAMYRGIGFDHVVLCLVNPSRTELQARFGLGNDVDNLLPLLHTPLNGDGHALARSLQENQEFRLTREKAGVGLAPMSEEFWRLSKARAIFIIPLKIDQVPFGVFYLDRLSTASPITEAEIQIIRVFRDQTILAIRATGTRL